MGSCTTKKIEFNFSLYTFPFTCTWSQRESSDGGLPYTMTLAVSRRTTEASRASEVFTDPSRPVRPEVLDLELELDLPRPPHALELDVFSRRYGDRDRADGRVGAAPVFEYLRPLDRCAASLLSSPASTSMAAGQLASVLSQTGEDCSTPWMVPESQ